MKDTARVLGRMYDGIEYRGFGQKMVEDLSKHLMKAGLEKNHMVTDYFPGYTDI